MKRPSNIFLGDAGFAKGSQVPLLNLSHGGQHGFTPDYRTLSASIPYVRRHMQVRLLSAPAGFARLGADARIHEAFLKALLETYPKAVEGITSTLSADFQGTPVGGSGEEFKVATDTKIAKTAPVFNYDEVGNKVIQPYFEWWHKTFRQNPWTKHPEIVHLVSDTSNYMEDEAGATVLFYETDITCKRIVDAWLSVNVSPKTFGQREAKRELTSAQELLSLSIEMTAITLSNQVVRALAQTLLDETNLFGFDPNRLPVNNATVAAGIKAATGGFQDKINELAATMG